MKRKHICQFGLILAAIASGLACSNEDEAFVRRNTDVLHFSHEASSQTFTVRSNGVWSVSSPDEWITLNPTTGAGDGEAYETVTVSVARNGNVARSGKALIHAAGRTVYISVHQSEGFLLFGTPSLSGSLAIGEPAADVNLRIPYSRAAGDEQFRLSVRVSGDAAAGLEPIVDYPASLTAGEGMIYVPLAGEPTKDGALRFSVSADYPNAYIEPLNVFVGASKAYHNADFVITGYMADPKGTDSPVIGAVSGGGFTHTGGYEYVQFLALKDIDFTVDKYCMVTTRNSSQSTPGDKGWVGGKDGTTKTYQINIDRGSVRKGDFFYVGGLSRLLNGYPTSGTAAMTPVAAAKWPIAVDYYTKPGDDGNGAATAGTGILRNWTTGTPLVHEAADGIAVFRGTGIDENTVPMDAIFYGSSLTKLVFQVPTNDHYSRLAADGTPQPYFGQGGNTWAVTTPPPGADDGWYCALGGEVNALEWITPRTPAYVRCKNTAGDGANATTAIVEEIPEATKFLTN
ncbi:MAG: BACON domain-containing protein [Prevotellaceae bacterium]|jgi:hypothetical protein|nr:BACON domain-containing protein [Prevotellaceae bacterium]